MRWSRELSPGRALAVVRVGSASLLTASTLALIAAQPWHSSRPGRFVVVSAVLLAVLTVQLLAAARLTSRRGELDPATLLAAALSAVVAAAAWLLPQLVRPAFPVSASSSLWAVEGAAVLAAVVAIVRTRDLRQAGLVALWAGGVSSFLVFAGALLAFATVPATVPNTQGRAMLPTATAAQRLAENRIEAPDGYLGLLALAAVLALVAWAVATSPRAAALAVRAPQGSR
jgi:hypothetical protein